MSICLIYGPVASGKLTTAQAFADQTGYKVFHNHLIQDILVDLIPYEREDLRESRALLSRRIRKDILSTALSADINIVMTMNFGGTGGLELLRHIVHEAKRFNQNVFVVRLRPSREELDRRIVGASRKAYKKADTPEILANLLEREGYGYEKFPDFEHLDIDNTTMPADETAKRIISHYGINVIKSKRG